MLFMAIISHGVNMPRKDKSKGSKLVIIDRWHLHAHLCDLAESHRRAMETELRSERFCADLDFYRTLLELMEL